MCTSLTGDKRVAPLGHMEIIKESISEGVEVYYSAVFAGR